MMYIACPMLRGGELKNCRADIDIDGNVAVCWPGTFREMPPHVYDIALAAERAHEANGGCYYV